MFAVALIALATSPAATPLDSFLPIVLSVLGLFGAAATAIGAVYGFRTARHRAGAQEVATGELIKALASAESTNNELRERIAAQAAHIEFADSLLKEQETRLRDQGERIRTLESQEERWQSRILELERLVWSTGSRREPPPSPEPGPIPPG